MIDIHMSQQSARLLESAMREVDRKTDWAIEKQSNKAMYYICRSAGAAMKPKSMSKKRESIPNPARRSKQNPKNRGAEFLIKVLHQDGPTTYLPTNSKTDKRRKIAKLGLARTTMRIAAGKFGKRPEGSMTKGASKFVRAIKQHSKGKHKVAVIDALTYLFDAFPGIVDTAVKKGLTSFIREFDRDWATSLSKGGS